VTVRIVHCLAVKLVTVIPGVLTTRWIATVITMPVVQVMVDVSIKVLRPVEPGSCADE
jgi:hypothetical protein